MNTPLVVIGGIVAVVAIGFAVWSWLERKKLLAAPVVTPDGVSAHTGEVIVSGIARGTVTESPWTDRQGLIFSAVELIEDHDRSQDGSTRRRTRRRSLGTHVEHVMIADPGEGTSTIAVQTTDKLDLRYFPKMTTSNRGSGLPSISFGPISLSSDRSRVEEVVVTDGDRVWVFGTLDAAPDGAAQLTGKQLWSAKDPDAMTKRLGLKVLAGAGAALAGVVLAIVGLAG